MFFKNLEKKKIFYGLLKFKIKKYIIKQYSKISLLVMNIVVVDVEKIQVETKKQQKMLFRKGIMVVFFALLMNMVVN